MIFNTVKSWWYNDKIINPKKEEEQMNDEQNDQVKEEDVKNVKTVVDEKMVDEADSSGSTDETELSDDVSSGSETEPVVDENAKEEVKEEVEEEVEIPMEDEAPAEEVELVNPVTNIEPVKNLETPMKEKSFSDLLKERGLDIAEDQARNLVEGLFDFVEYAIEKSHTKIDDMFLGLLPQGRGIALKHIDKIDGRTDG